MSALDLQQVAATEANILRFATALTGSAGAIAELDPEVAAHLHRRLDAAGTQWATTAKTVAAAAHPSQ